MMMMVVCILTSSFPSFSIPCRPYVQVGRTRDTPSYRYGFDVVIGGEQEGGEHRATAADYEEEDESEDIIFDQLR